MYVDLSVDSRPLRKTGDDGPKPSISEPKTSYCCIFNLDVGMIQVRPVPTDLSDRAHEPLKQIQQVRRLIHQHAAALGRPLAPPRIGTVISLVAPTEHHCHAENRRADLTLVDGG